MPDENASPKVPAGLRDIAELAGKSGWGAKLPNGSLLLVMGTLEAGAFVYVRHAYLHVTGPISGVASLDWLRGFTEKRPAYCGINAWRDKVSGAQLLTPQQLQEALSAAGVSRRGSTPPPPPPVRRMTPPPPPPSRRALGPPR